MNIKEMFKNEIASELGIKLGAEQTARNNGKIGGEMTKRLVKLGEIKLQEIYEEQKEIGNNIEHVVPEYIIEEDIRNNELLH